MRHLQISEYGAGVVPHYDPSNLPFFALHWGCTGTKKIEKSNKVIPKAA